MNFPRLIISLFLLGLLSLPAIAQEKNQSVVGRYLTVSQIPLVGQADLLSQTFEVRFPNNINTIGDAINYLLHFSGYRLIETRKLCPAAQSLLIQPLPEIDRNLGPLSLKDGLLTLAGEPFQLIVDPVHRLISFSLKPSYAKIYNSH